MTDQEKSVLLALMSGENAEGLIELSQRSNKSVLEVADILDRLVEQHILLATESYHRSEIGEVVYMFCPCDYAQDIYASLEGL